MFRIPAKGMENKQKIQSFFLQNEICHKDKKKLQDDPKFDSISTGVPESTFSTFSTLK